MASSFFMICNLMMIAAALARPQNVEWQPQVVGLPYYGGARGQVLQITRDQNGAILNQVIVPVVDAQQNAATFFQPQNFQDPTNANFDMSFYNLQTSAQRLVDLQQKIQRTGQLEPQERTDFNSNLALLGQSASNLAQSSASGQELEALLGAQGMRTTSDANGVEKNGELPADENEEDVGEELGTEGDSNVVTQEDTVFINGPPDSASVAEAKPVGLAIAGEGGVASSKPMATAVVGPGGLAIARPVATAIAGVDPRTAGVPIPSSAKAPSAPIAAFRRRADHLLAGRLN